MILKHIKDALEGAHIMGMPDFESAIMCWDRGLQHLSYEEIPYLLKEMAAELNSIDIKWDVSIQEANELLDLKIDFAKVDKDLADFLSNSQ